MSDYAVDSGEADASPVSLEGVPLARYTIHVPVRNNKGREIPHVLAEARQFLTNSGLPNRTVIRRAHGDWKGDEDYFETEEVDLIMIDAGQDEQTLKTIQDAARLIKDASQQEAVYVTVQAITTYLV